MQANFTAPSTTTRHPPHIPVPSSMTGLSETVTGTPWRTATSEHARIIGTGPTAKTRSTSPASSSRSSGTVTRPFSPYEPSSVITCTRAPGIARNLSSSTSRSRLRAATIASTVPPACAIARATGYAAARPTPPPATAHRPATASVGLPRGPVTSSRQSPSEKRSSSVFVVWPTARNTNSIHPSSAFQSQKVNGTRSPPSSARSRKNWPARALAATAGASTRMRQVPCASTSFLRIRCMCASSLGQAASRDAAGPADSVRNRRATSRHALGAW